MSDNKLVFYPLNPLAGLDDPDDFLDQLQQAGFIDQAFNWFGETHYRPGSEFFKLIDFLNEHTAILLEPSEQGLIETARVSNSSVCHIFLNPVSNEPRIIASGSTEAPYCSNCNYHESGIDMLGEWYDDKVNYRWLCPNCGLEFLIHELNWQHTVGFCRYSIDVWNIHLDEAIPTELLLQKLQSITGETWTYLYYRL